MLQDGYDRFLSISLNSRVTFPIRDLASALGNEVVIASSLPCLADGKPPFRRRPLARMADTGRALKRRLWPVRTGE